MSKRQRASIVSFHVVPIVAVLMAASMDIRAFAQTDQNAPAAGEPLPAAVDQAPPKDVSTVPKGDAIPAPKPQEGIPAMVVDGEQVQGILGKQVRSSAGEDMGRIVDVIVDRSARVRAAVIDFGGFLGVGNRQIAVAWSAIRFSNDGSKPGQLIVDFTRDQLRVAPAYKAGEQIVLLGAPANVTQGIGGAPDKEPSPTGSPAK